MRLYDLDGERSHVSASGDSDYPPDEIGLWVLVKYGEKNYLNSSKETQQSIQCALFEKTMRDQHCKKKRAS